METAYSILQNHLSPPYCLSLLIIFIATLVIWKVVEKRQMVAKTKWTQAVLISLLVTYIFFILLITLIARTPAVNPDGTLNHKAELIPFWSWYEVIVNHSSSLAVEIILNVIFFMPVGILARLQNFRLRPILLFSIFFSLCIELTQYFTCRGLCEIFDDVIGNMVGGVIGYLGCGYVVRMVEKRRCDEHTP